MVVTTFDLILAARFKKIKTCRFSFLFFSCLSFSLHVSCVHQPQMSRELSKTSCTSNINYEQKDTKQGTKK